MPPRPRPWFRLYSETAHNLKFHNLPDRLAKPWIVALCLAGENTPRGTLPPLQKYAFALRVKEDKAQAILDGLVKHGFVDRKGSEYVMHEWDDWQKDRDVAPSLRDGKSRVNHANSDDSVTKITLEKEREKEKEVEVEKDTEREQEAARSVGFVPSLDPPWPDEPGFAGQYVRNVERRTGKHPGASQVSDAIQLEREFGLEECVRVANDTNWEKPPRWLRYKLEERKNDKSRTPTPAGPDDSPFAGIGRRVSAEV